MCNGNTFDLVVSNGLPERSACPFDALSRTCCARKRRDPRRTIDERCSRCERVAPIVRCRSRASLRSWMRLRRVFCRFCHARSRVPMVFGPFIIAPSVNVLRRTRRKPSTIRGAAPDVVIGQSTAARAGAHPYRVASRGSPPHRKPLLPLLPSVQILFASFCENRSGSRSNGREMGVPPVFHLKPQAKRPCHG